MNERQSKPAAVEWTKTERPHMLDSEPNCRQSNPWTTRPHGSVIGSCTLESHAKKSTPWKSTIIGNSLSVSPLLHTAINHTRQVMINQESQVSFRTKQSNNQEYPWSVKTGWLGKSHTNSFNNPSILKTSQLDSQRDNIVTTHENF